MSMDSSVAGIKKVPTPISSDFSIYLDLLRFLAAMFVLLFHIRKLHIGPDQVLSRIPDHGHDAVIMFFVLSGYVIAAATDRKSGKGLREYILDRAARVYSVAVPTLVFCALLAVFVQPLIDPAEIHPLSQLAFESLVNLLFVAQSWTWKIWVYFNQPYWSLCYEVMYYVGFGVVVFMRGRARWLGLIVVALIAGPKVLLLMPCWLFGVLAYTYRDRWTLRPAFAAFIAFVVPPLILVLLHYLGFGPWVRSFGENVLGITKDYLEFSNEFLIDYTTALLVAVNLYAVRFFPLALPKYFGAFIVAGAAMSFTMYLMHLPLIFIVMHLAGSSRDSLVSFFAAAIGVPAICYFISKFTEQQRPRLRKLLNDLLPQGRTVALVKLED